MEPWCMDAMIRDEAVWEKQEERERGAGGRI
jgi:hypothetical protein